MKPSKDKLHSLYYTSRLSTRAIATRFGVSHMSVKRWLRAYDIERRPTGRGLANRGITPPTRDDLERLVHKEHHSYETIAVMFGVNPAAVGHWLKKHNIRRPTQWETKRKGVPLLPSADELRTLYGSGLSLAEIGRRYSVSHTPIRELCSRYGIPVRDSGWNTDWLTCVDGHRVRSTYELRVDNWLTEHDVEHVYEPQLPFDRRYHADFLANGWYIEIWGVLNMARYTRSNRRKLDLYRAHNVPLIEIPVHAFDAAHTGLWKRRLHNCLSRPITSLMLLESPV